MFDLEGATAPGEPRPMPWDAWSPGRRQWSALGAAAAVFALGAVAALAIVWP